MEEEFIKCNGIATCSCNHGCFETGKEIKSNTDFYMDDAKEVQICFCRVLNMPKLGSLLAQKGIFVIYQTGTPTQRGGESNTYPQTIPWSIPTPMLNFSPFGPAVWAPIGNKQTNKQTTIFIYQIKSLQYSLKHLESSGRIIAMK